MSAALAFLLGGALALLMAWFAARRFGFAGQQPAAYATMGPRFDPTVHLNGPMLCEGVIYGPRGRVVSRFVADMEGRWQGGLGVLTERFRYDSGAEQARRWELHLGDGGMLVATAADLLGEARGWVSGSAVVMRYRIRLTPESGGHVLDVTDWMYLLENGTIINRSQFRKFGVKVAELVATMRPKPVP